MNTARGGVLPDQLRPSRFPTCRIQTGVAHNNVVGARCRMPVKVAQYLLNNKREELLEMEKNYGAQIRIEPAPEMTPADHTIEFIKAENGSDK